MNKDHKQSRRRYIRGIGAAGISVLLTGCSSQGGGDQTTTESATPTTTPTNTPESTPTATETGPNLEIADWYLDKTRGTKETVEDTLTRVGGQLEEDRNISEEINQASRSTIGNFRRNELLFAYRTLSQVIPNLDVEGGRDYGNSVAVMPELGVQNGILHNCGISYTDENGNKHFQLTQPQLGNKDLVEAAESEAYNGNWEHFSFASGRGVASRIEALGAEDYEPDAWRDFANRVATSLDGAEPRDVTVVPTFNLHLESGNRRRNPSNNLSEFLSAYDAAVERAQEFDSDVALASYEGGTTIEVSASTVGEATETWKQGVIDYLS